MHVRKQKYVYQGVVSLPVLMWYWPQCQERPSATLPMTTAR